MNVGIFAKVFARSDLDETLRLIAGHGIRHTQFNMSCAGLASLPERIPPDLAARIKAGLDRHGIGWWPSQAHST